MGESLPRQNKPGSSVSRRPDKNLMARVERAVVAVLQRDGRLTYPSLPVEVGVLTPRDEEAWRTGRIPFLERVIRANLTKLARIQTAVRPHARVRSIASRNLAGLR